MTFFIFGAGYSARSFASTQTAPVYGTTRHAAKCGALQAANIIPLLFDGAPPTAPLAAALAQTTRLIISIAPGSNGDPVLALPGLRQYLPRLEWIGYLSTIGVYGDHGGRWINETAPCQPSLQRNKIRLEVEKGWQAFAANHHVPLAILRLAGIYGPGRNAFVKLRDGTAHRIVKPGQVFNRIHVSDIAGAICHLADTRQGGIFNVCDDEPAPPQDVVTYAAKLMGVAPPPEIPFENAVLSSMARSFYGDNKRVSNELLRESGYHPLYRDYRQALTKMWQSKNW